MESPILEQPKGMVHFDCRQCMRNRTAPSIHEIVLKSMVTSKVIGIIIASSLIIVKRDLKIFSVISADKKRVVIAADIERSV